MTDHRTDPPVAADEVTTLRGFLDFHRDTLRWKTAGLDAAELAHRLRPSSMTLGGLLKHLAFVESQWFSQVFRGEELMPPFDTADWADDRDWDWTSAAGDSPEELRMLFDRAVAASDAVLDAALADGGLDRLSRAPTGTRASAGRCAGSSCTWSRSTRGTTVTPTCCARRSTGPWGSSAAVGCRGGRRPGRWRT